MRLDLAVEAGAEMRLADLRHRVVTQSVAFDLRPGEGGDDETVARPLITEKRACANRMANQLGPLGLRRQALHCPTVSEAAHHHRPASIERIEQRALYADGTEGGVSAVDTAETTVRGSSARARSSSLAAASDHGATNSNAAKTAVAHFELRMTDFTLMTVLSPAVCIIMYR